MASDKQKPKDPKLRSNETPKAGPRSNGRGRNRGTTKPPALLASGIPTQRHPAAVMVLSKPSINDMLNDLATRDFTMAAEHANLALNHGAINSLRDASVARKLAYEALFFYPMVTATSSKSRIEIAFEKALNTLSDDNKKRVKSIQVAKSAVKRALRMTASNSPAITTGTSVRQLVSA